MNWVWFQTLKNSPRNCRLLPRDSLRTKFLNKDRFQLSRPGPRTELRGVLPKQSGPVTQVRLSVDRRVKPLVHRVGVVRRAGLIRPVGAVGKNAAGIVAI